LKKINHVHYSVTNVRQPGSAIDENNAIDAGDPAWGGRRAALAVDEAPADDPYFFLTPKITQGRSVSTPVELYKKGATVDFTFWLTPLPTSKLLYLFPVSPPSTHIVLNIKKSEEANINFFPTEIFSKEGPVNNLHDTSLLTFEIYRINDNLTETLIFKRII
jgi:hypothetical protein